MEEKIRQLSEQGRAALETASTEEELEAARVLFLGRKGLLREIRQGMKDLPQEERPALGRLINQTGRQLEALLEQRRAELLSGEAAVPEDGLDVTLPGRAPRTAGHHPLLSTMEDMIEVFLGLGYTVVEGPDIEDYYHAFEALNYPEDHPAMDEQMTFYLEDDVLLRSQTSTVQIRVMENQEPPVRVVVPGRCFRRDTVDATHCHTFYQLEGLLVDEGITFADLKGTLQAFAEAMFGPEVRVRFRPDFFPFTEPSAEFAVSCFICGGSGCRVCSGTGWLELGGSGMVDPNVLAGVGYDTEKYTGFAFGVGIERFAMLRYGIKDIRVFYSGDMRVLTQF